MEAALKRAILEEPFDQLHRSAYADYLEDRGEDTTFLRTGRHIDLLPPSWAGAVFTHLDCELVSQYYYGVGPSRTGCGCSAYHE